MIAIDVYAGGDLDTSHFRPGTALTCANDKSGGDQRTANSHDAHYALPVIQTWQQNVRCISMNPVAIQIQEEL